MRWYCSSASPGEKHDCDLVYLATCCLLIAVFLLPALTILAYRALRDLIARR